MYEHQGWQVINPLGPPVARQHQELAWMASFRSQKTKLPITTYTSDYSNAQSYGHNANIFTVTSGYSESNADEEKSRDFGLEPPPPMAFASDEKWQPLRFQLQS